MTQAMAVLRALPRLFWLVIFALLLPISSAYAAARDSVLCSAAIAAIERSERMPDGLLWAIGRVESGRFESGAGALVSWPWTVDIGGVGQFYETKTAAIAAVRATQATGIRSIDIGCLQVNLLYHPNAFVDLNEAFDPQANVLYAARFLRQLFTRTGSWSLAAAAYHSQTPELGAEYGARVLAQWNPQSNARRKTKTGAAGDPSPYPQWPPPGVAYAAFAPADFAYRAFAAVPQMTPNVFSPDRKFPLIPRRPRMSTMSLASLEKTR